MNKGLMNKELMILARKNERLSTIFTNSELKSTAIM